MVREDTIVAIATPPGEGAIGIVRVSGIQALAVVAHLFRPQANRPTRPFEPYHVYHGALHHPLTGDLIDEVLLTTFRAPKSYTGEDVVEISAHGSTVVLRAIVEACCDLQSSISKRSKDAALSGLNPQSSIRLAEPGEFTLRAFLNGKLTL